MPDSGDPSVREMVAVLRRGRGFLALFVASAMISSLALTLIYSERYRATTTIMYRPNAAVQFEARNQQTALGFPVPLLPFEVLGQTIGHVGTSECILRPVVVDLGLDRPDTTRRSGLAKLYHDTKEAVKEFSNKAWQVLKYGRTIDENRATAAIVELAANTTIDTSKKDYASTLTVVDKDPVRAARIADRIGVELVKFIGEQSVQAAHEQGGELEALLAAKKEEIDGARSAIESLKSSGAFIDLAEETSLHLKTAEQFQLELMKNEADLSAARAELVALEAQREALSPMLKASETISDDPVFDKLRETRVSSEIELQGLFERSPKEHPDIRSTQAQIRTADRLLSSTDRTRVSQVAMQLNAIYQSVHGQELKARARVAGLGAANESMKANLAQARSRITRPELEKRHNELRLQLDELEADFKKLATLREEVRAVELTSKAEVRTLHDATPQDKPFRPIKVYHVLLSGLLALILGVGVIFLIDFSQSLLRDGARDPGRAPA
jgi:uncharacterized protein involved in exopolysaccharide biosynthesis